MCGNYAREIQMNTVMTGGLRLIGKMNERAVIICDHYVCLLSAITVSSSLWEFRRADMLRVAM